MALSPQDQAMLDELIARQNGRGSNQQFASQAPGATQPSAPSAPQQPPTLQGLMSQDPSMLEAGADAAGAMSPRNSMALMGMGVSSPTPGGGGLIARKSPFESAAEGVKTGMGMYNLLNTQKAKSDALRKMAGMGGNPMAKMSPFGSDPEMMSAESMPIDMGNPMAQPI